jgi:hypothetical protein
MHARLAMAMSHTNSHEQTDVMTRSAPEWRAMLMSEGRIAVEELLREPKLNVYVAALESGDDAWAVRVDKRTPHGWKSIDLRVDGALLVASRHDEEARRRILAAWEPQLVSAAEKKRATQRLLRETRRQLEEALQQLVYALEETQLSEERHNLQEELMRLEDARARIDQMSAADLERLHRQLSQQRPDWIARSTRRIL